MKEIFGICKKLTLPLIGIIVCLVIQALLDLSLPGYTSDIVDTGIVAGGIKNYYPDVIRESEYNKIIDLMDEEEKNIVNDSYSLIGIGNSNYIELYPILEKEEVYIINNNIDSDKLNDIFLIPITVIYNLENNSIYSNMDNFSLKKIVNEIDESIISSQVKTYIKNEYKVIGIDTDKLQTNYIISSGIRMLLIALIIMIIAIVISYLSSKVAASFGKSLREKVTSKVMQYSEKELRDFSIASLITRSTNDIQNIQAVLAMGFRSIFFAPIMGIGAFIKVYNSTGSMSWVVGIGLGAVIIVMLVLLFIVLPKTKIMQKLIDKVNLLSREILTGLPVVRTFNTAKYEEERFDKANNELTKTNLFVNKIMSMMGPTMSLIMNGMCILIIWIGSYQVQNGNIGVGNLLALIQYSMHIIFSFLIVAILSISLPRVIVSIKRINEILTKDISIKDRKKLKKFNKDIQGEVEFKNVCFKYPDSEEYTLSNINFKAKKGETIAIIGSTGSGKSTLINLIPRFFDVTDGSILIDGVDIRDVSQKDLRSKLGYVPQKGILYSGTIKSNISFGSNIDDKVIKKVAKVAQAEEFIIDREDNYNSEISQGGKNVSGGQKQRLSIARAIANNPEIYLFDDSFSALDYKTDVKLRKALKEYTKDATLIIVTQRVSTVINADEIIVLDNGIVVGKGKHKDLINNCDVYKEIALSQLSKEELA